MKNEIKLITFKDVAKMNLIGRWMETWQIVGIESNCCHRRYLIRSFTQVGTHLQVAHNGRLKYDPTSGSWPTEISTQCYDAFYNSRCENHYCGPYELESGVIVWLFGNLTDPESAHFLYPSNIQPPSKPFGEETLLLIQAEYA